MICLLRTPIYAYEYVHNAININALITKHKLYVYREVLRKRGKVRKELEKTVRKRMTTGRNQKARSKVQI